MCVDSVLVSLRIAQVDPDNEPLPDVVLSHINESFQPDPVCLESQKSIRSAEQGSRECGHISSPCQDCNFPI
jgi:hypothetical protein